MHHGFRPLDRKKHGAGDLEMDAGKQTVPGIKCGLRQILTGCHPEIGLSGFEFIV
jgi:hypothetical protein